MTWTKLSDDFGVQCAALSDAAFRVHVEGLIWTMRRESGGYLTVRDVVRLSESPHAEMAVVELVACGWWSVEGQGYQINHHMEHQPEPDVLARRRQLDAERQRRRRRNLIGIEAGPSRRDTTRDNTRDSGRVGSGRVGNDKSATKGRTSTARNARTDDDIDAQP